MARLYHGAVLTVLSSLIWGTLGMIVIGVTLTLLSGAPAQPPVGIAALASLVGALVLTLRPPPERSQVTLVLSAVAVLLVLLVMTFAKPFGIGLGAAPLWQVVALLVLLGTVTAANWLCVGDLKLSWLTRYEFEDILVRIFKGIGFVVFTVIVALPFFVMVMTSLKNQQALLANPLDFSIDFSHPAALFRSYYELFAQFNFGRYLLISTIVSIATVVLTLLFSVPGAYAVARLRFPGQAVLSNSILLIYMVPAIVLVIPLYAVFSQLGLRDTITGLLIVYPATTIPVALYMLQGYFRGLPVELEEAGLMDGLSRVGVILKITLPLALPALASVSLYVFMIAWNEFLFAFMFLDDPKIFTLSRGVVSLDSSEVPRQYLMAGAVVATVPVMVIFLWFERFMVQGLTAGSVKG